MRRWLTALLLLGAAPAAERPLRVIAIDVEGGSAILWVTPEGRSLLIDTGWPAGLGGPKLADGTPAPQPSSAERIVAAAREAGLTRIDTLLVTHYHVDHVGGVEELLHRFPVGTIVDHGPNREALPPDATPDQRRYAPATLYPRYLAAIAGHPHRVMRPGETLRVGRLLLTVVDSDRARLSRPLPGGGGPGVGCAEAMSKVQDGGEENARSLGVLASWGRARLLALGDTSWDMENALVCPVDMIGPVDLLIANNHGSAISNSPPFVHTVRPRVVLFNNGPRKGADPSSFDTVRAAPGPPALWQLHAATRSPERDAPAGQIANLADSPDGATLTAAVTRDGGVTMINYRTGDVVAYPPR